MHIIKSFSARFSALFDSCTAPTQLKLNRNTGLIRLIACLCMAIDHFGKMCFPHIPEMRMIGRLAFPLFAYGIAVGAIYTRNPLKYLSRIVLLALISQPLYAIALAHESSAMYAVSFFDHPIRALHKFYTGSWHDPSILLSLALGLCIMICLKKKQWILAIGVYILCERFWVDLDYGIMGIRLMLLFYMLAEHPIAALMIIPSFMTYWATGDGRISLQVYAVPAGIFACLPVKGNLRLPRWFIYGFYPAHLALLAVIVKLF